MLPHRVRWELGIGDREYATVVRLGRVFGHEDCVAENDTSRRAGIPYSLFPFPAPAYALQHDPPASHVAAQAERGARGRGAVGQRLDRKSTRLLQSLMRISSAVFCLKKKN